MTRESGSRCRMVLSAACRMSTRASDSPNIILAMIEYRPFRNTDPPALCEIWRNQPPLRALFQPMTTVVFEDTVLSKPFFDRAGLIVATENQRPVGFVHAGFGPTADGKQLDPAFGATCMLMVAHHPERMAIAENLLQRSEAYLAAHGTRSCYGGGMACIAPFYNGLYGGCSVPGIVESAVQVVSLYRSAGYAEQERRLILQRSLAGFRPSVDRQQIQYRRGHDIEVQADPPSGSWWEACVTAHMDRTAYLMRPRSGGAALGTAVFWNMEPLASSWGVHARGLWQLDIPVGPEQEALAVFILGESLRLAGQEGVTLIEAQVSATDASMKQVLTGKLGFQVIEEAIVFRKELDALNPAPTECPASSPFAPRK